MMAGYKTASFDPDAIASASDAASSALAAIAGASDAASAAMGKAAAASSRIAARSSAWESGGLDAPVETYDFLVGSEDVLTSVLEFEGADNSTTITDLTGRSWSVVGNAVIDTAQYRVGSSSLYLDSDSYIYSAMAPGFAFGAGDFHVKFSMKPEIEDDFRIGFLSNNVDADSPISFIYYGSGAKTLEVKICHPGYSNDATWLSCTLTAASWSDLVISREGNTFSLFLGGVVQAYRTVESGTTLPTTTLDFRIGGDATTWDNFQGWIDGVRVAKEAYDANKTYTLERTWEAKTLAQAKQILGVESVQTCWPVGSVFISVVSTNPATLIGFGTWAAIAAGRVLVGRDSADASFDVAEETGGAKTSTPNAHTGANVSAHAGCSIANHTSVSSKQGTASGNVVTTNTHTVTQANNHTITQPSAHAAMSIVQPYFVVYMWKRTA